MIDDGKVWQNFIIGLILCISKKIAIWYMILYFMSFVSSNLDYLLTLLCKDNYSVWRGECCVSDMKENGYIYLYTLDSGIEDYEVVLSKCIQGFLCDTKSLVYITKVYKCIKIIIRLR